MSSGPPTKRLRQSILSFDKKGKTCATVRLPSASDTRRVLFVKLCTITDSKLTGILVHAVLFHGSEILFDLRLCVKLT
jgi:hypothetical protein